MKRSSIVRAATAALVLSAGHSFAAEAANVSEALMWLGLGPGR